MLSTPYEIQFGVKLIIMDKLLGSKKTIAIFVLPGVIFFTLMIFIPIIASVAFSFFEWDGIGKMQFIGFQNFRSLLQDNIDNYWISVKNTVIMALLTAGVQLPLAFILAVVLSEGIKGEGFFRTVYFTPVVVSSSVIGLLFLKIYNPDYGILNVILKHLGLESLTTAWLGNPKTALAALFFPIVWQYIGYHMLLLYAGIKSISPEIFESAKIDGAKLSTIVRKITLPMIAPMIEVCLTLGIIGSIKIFDLSIILTNNGEPLGATLVQAGLMYKQIFQYGMYGLGSATSILIIIQCLLVTVILQRIFKNTRI
jgi:raffinose/stachyose/melibiose transport system permease protein